MMSEIVSTVIRQWVGRLTILVLASVGALASAADDPQQPADVALRRPEWIWLDGIRTPQQSIVLSRAIVPSGRITQAHVRLAAEFTRCRLVIGGRTVVSLDEFAPWLDLDVAEFLRPGENRLQLHCEGTDGPSAVLLSLVMTFDDGSQQTVDSDASWQGQLVAGNSAAAELTQKQATSFGPVASRVWNAWVRGRRISAFEDYTQWKQALQESDTKDSATFATLPGFEIERLRTALPEEGSWVSMAFDPQGRLTIAREERGLLRFTFSEDGSVAGPPETINDSLLECRGLLYAYGALYANANDSKAMYRLRDTDGDDQFDEELLLREFPGSAGHGRNDLALGPDGLIYSIHGDAVDVPLSDIFDRTSPFRESRRGQPEREGHLIRTDREGKQWELIAAGLRNPFGIDFNTDGELFTYDADAEFDMGAPWYRATRIQQLVSGADYGWRGRTKQWPPYQLDHADNALPALEIGKGSPTAVKSGKSSSFPEAYRESMFVLDWAYGRVLACHLVPRGAGYVGRMETFLQGRPLNVTDLDFGPDGAMYLVTGGRKTESSLYRVRYRGSAVDPEPKTRQQIDRETYSRRQREQRSELEQFHSVQSAEAISVAWPYLGSSDPVLRHAARVAIEHQPVADWKNQALNESDLPTHLVALSALARSGDATACSEVLARLNEVPTDELSSYDQLTALQAYALCLADTAELDAALLQQTRERLSAWMQQQPRRRHVAPRGAGGDVVRRLTHLVVEIDATSAIPTIVDLLKRANSQKERMEYLFVLREQPSKSWPADGRRTFFETLADLEMSAQGGDGMPGFLKRIRDEATATLTEDERESLGELLTPAADRDPQLLTINREVYREWTPADQGHILAQDGEVRDLDRGRELFRSVLCSHCHRRGTTGGVIGPDLTSVGNRFSRRDILTSILNPSQVIAEPYRNAQVVTRQGQVISGRVLTQGDYRSPTLRIATDPLDATKVVEIPKVDIELHQASVLSPMPQGLINTLNEAEILDLLAYLQSPPVD